MAFTQNIIFDFRRLLQMVKWLTGNKLSWYPVLLYLTIQFCTIQRRFTVDYLYQKLLILVQICWKYLRIS